MEAVIHEALGEVFDGDGLEAAQVEDALVGDEAGRALVENRIVLGEAAGDVVGVEDGELRGFGQSRRSHGGDVHPGNREDARAAPRRGGDGADGVFAAEVHDGMAGEKIDEMFGDADGAHAGAAAAVRDAEGFVEVEMADIRADVAGAAEADLGVEVRAVHVHLAAVGVDDLADFPDAGLEDAVGRGIGDHEAAEIIRVFGGLGAEVGEIDVAVLVAGDGDDGEAGHDGAGGVGAVGGGGDEADVAVRLAAGLVIFVDDEEAGVFALRTGVGLEGNAREAGDLGEPVFELLEHHLVAAGLLERREGMEARELGPAHGKHLARGIQLHRAGAERNHRVAEREVARFEAAHIAQQLGLGVVAVEDGVREERAGARERRAETGGDGGVEFVDAEGGRGVAVEDAEEKLDVLGVGGFVERDGDGGGVDDAQIDKVLLGDFDNVGAGGVFERDG